MSEPTNLGMAAAVAGGYLLGRTKKGQIALTAAALLAGRGLHPRALVTGGVRRIPGLPGGGKDETADGGAEESSGRGDRSGLSQAARNAASAVTNRGLTALSGALQERTRGLTEGVGGSVDGEGDAGDGDDGAEDTRRGTEPADAGQGRRSDRAGTEETDEADDTDDAEAQDRPAGPRRQRPRTENASAKPSKPAAGKAAPKKRAAAGGEPAREGKRASEAKPAAKRRPPARKPADAPARSAKKSAPARKSAAKKPAAKSRTTAKSATRPQTGQVTIYGNRPEEHSSRPDADGPPEARSRPVPPRTCQTHRPQSRDPADGRHRAARQGRRRQRRHPEDRRPRAARREPRQGHRRGEVPGHQERGDRKVKGVKEAVSGGGSDKGDSSSDTKATNIAEMIDVGVPLRTAYDHWTEYESFSGFTKGVQEAERGDDATSEWTVKVGPSTRKWKATVQEQIPDDRIVWSSEGAQGTTQGAVSFHEITPTLTRIILVLVYYPTGIVEKTGNIWRAQGRRARLDFKNFQRYVTFAEDEAEGWRGEIRNGEIVRTHEEAVAEEEEDLDEAEGEDDEETDEYEDGDEPEEEDEEDDGR